MKFKIKLGRIKKTIKFDDKKILKDMLGMDLGKLFKTVIDGVVNDILGIIKKIFISPFKKLGKVIQSSMKGLLKVINSVFNSIMIPIRWITKALSTFMKIIKNTFKSITTILKNAFKQIGQFFKMLGNVIGKAFGQFGKIMMGVFKVIAKHFMILIQFLQKFFLMVGAFFAKLFEQLSKGFSELFYYLICGWKKIIAFPTCIVYYAIELAIFCVLLPFRFVFWMVPPLRPMEDMIWDLVDIVDNLVFTFTTQAFGKGYHINQWSNDIMNRCYRCKPEKEKIDDTSIYDQASEMFEEGGGSFFSFAFQIFMVLFMMVVIGIYVYSLFTDKSCTPMDTVY